MDLTMATTLLVRAFLIVTMLSIGLRLSDRRSSPAARTPRVVAGLLVANFIFVPLVGILVVGVVGLAGGVAIGVLATAMAPAGFLGPELVQVARGDLRFGVVATFVLAIVATFTMVPSLAFAQRLLGVNGSTAPIDPAVVVASLAVFQLAPLIVGLILSRRAIGLTRRAVGPLTSLSTLLIVAVIVVTLLDTGDELLHLGGGPIVAMLAIVLAASGLGAIAGGPDREVRRATTIITAQRAPALALLIVAGPGHAVETATVAAFALVLLVVNSGVAFGLGRDWSSLAMRRQAVRPPLSDDRA